MLEFDGPFGSALKLRGQRLAVVRFFECLAKEFGFEHGKVVGDNQADFLFAPVLMRCFIFFARFLALVPHGEAKFPQDEVCLTGGLPAAELVRREDAANRVLAGKTDYGFQSIPIAGVDQFVACGSAERMVDAAVQVTQRLDDVFVLQTWRNRLWQSVPRNSPRQLWSACGTVARGSDYSIT